MTLDDLHYPPGDHRPQAPSSTPEPNKRLLERSAFFEDDRTQVHQAVVYLYMHGLKTVEAALRPSVDRRERSEDNLSCEHKPPPEASITANEYTVNAMRLSMDWNGGQYEERADLNWEQRDVPACGPNRRPSCL